VGNGGAVVVGLGHKAECAWRSQSALDTELPVIKIVQRRAALVVGARRGEGAHTDYD